MQQCMTTFRSGPLGRSGWICPLFDPATVMSSHSLKRWWQFRIHIPHSCATFTIVMYFMWTTRKSWVRSDGSFKWRSFLFMSASSVLFQMRPNATNNVRFNIDRRPFLFSAFGVNANGSIHLLRERRQTMQQPHPQTFVGSTYNCPDGLTLVHVQSYF